MSLSKWLFGGLGFVLGGPIGALIGVAVGSLFDRPMLTDGSADNTTHNATSFGTSGRRTSYRATQSDVKISLMVLVACVMKADGHVKKAELNAVKQFLLKNYDEEGALEALQILKKLLEQDIDPVAVSRQIATYVNYSTRLQLLHFLLDLANADGEFHLAEETVILRISNAMNISSADYRSLLSLYKKDKDPNWAYEALECEPGATNEEVKKAYRRVAMKYHPDKVAGAGEEMKAKATEKFQAIQDAYEYIKKQRNID